MNSGQENNNQNNQNMYGQSNTNNYQKTNIRYNGVNNQNNIPNNQNMYGQNMNNYQKTNIRYNGVNNQNNIPNNQNMYGQNMNNYQNTNIRYNGVNNQNIYGQYNKKKKKSSLGIFFIVILLIGAIVFGLYLLGSSETKTDGPHKNPDYERTIMIYMAGSNLESDIGAGTSDLNGLDYNKLKEQNTKVIVLAGAAKRWFNNYIDSQSTSIYELTENGYKVVKKQSLTNMGLSSTLKDFLNYGFDNYKSKKYDLVLWNHGGAVQGAEQDVFFNNDMLNLSEMKTALSESKFSKNNKLELVMFRTCLMGTIETANTFKDYSDYLVASEEVIILTKDKKNVLEFFNGITKTDDGNSIGKKAVDQSKNYINFINNRSNTNYYNTYSVIDLSKIDELNSAVNDFFSDANVSKNYNTVAKVRAGLYQYGLDLVELDSVDLYNLVNNLKSLSPTKGEKILNILDKTIVYNISTDQRSRGLAIYFPYNGIKTNNVANIFINRYYNFDELADYKKYISSFVNSMLSNSSKMSFSANSIQLNRVNDVSDFQIVLTDEQKKDYSKAGYIVFRKNTDGTYLPVYSGPAQLNGNTLSANIKDRQLKVIDLNDNSSGIISLTQKEETDDYILYTTYGTLEKIDKEDINNSSIVSAQINLKLDKKNNSISISSVYTRPETENKEGDISIVSYNAIVELEDYDTITIGSSSYKILDSKGNYDSNWQSNGVFVGQKIKIDNMKLELQDYNNTDEYYAVFVITDFNNNVNYSKLVKMK